MTKKKSNNITRLLFIQLAYDGIVSKHCGVGAVLQNSLAAIRIINKTPKKFLKITCYLIAPNYSHLQSYSHKILRKNKKFCNSTGGDLMVISHPEIFEKCEFGTLRDWEICSKIGAKYCECIIKNNNQSHDGIIVVSSPKLRVNLQIGNLSCYPYPTRLDQTC